MKTKPSKQLIFLLLPLLAAKALLAQDTAKDSLQAAFTRYYAQAPQEKLFAHIDRTFYLSGETIWFSLYDIDGNTNRPAALSAIAYVEILDKDHHPVLQAKIGLSAGKGDGSFNIPLSLPSGEYLFRAYTSWMRNFSPDLFYHQPLTILNTLKDPVPDSAPVSRTADTARPAIRFFPEGGNLVENLTSTVAVRVTDLDGSGISCDGVVTDRKEDTIARFHTNGAGNGRFTLTPAPGESYRAVATVGHATVTQPVPAAYGEGYVMHVESRDDRQLRVLVRASGATANPLVYLFVHTRARIRSIQMNLLTGGQTSFIIDKDSLDPGISHLTVFNGDRLPVCERLWFREPDRRLHIGLSAAAPSSPASAADGTAPHTVIPTRTRLAVDLSTTDNAGLPMPADLSMSVFRLDSLQSVPANDILSWLLLGSELEGPVRLPPEGIDSTGGPAAAEMLDDLMLTQGWSRFRWEEFLSSPKPVFDFLPETNGPVINAKAIARQTGRPPHPVVGYLSIAGPHPVLATGLSRPDGNLYFHLENFYGNPTLITQTNGQIDSTCRIEISSAWSERYAAYALATPVFSPGWSGQLLQRSIDAQVGNAYLLSERHRFTPIEEDTADFYGAADLSYNLDDYTRFVTMEEVIQEFVDNVRIRRRSGQPYFRVRNSLFNIFFDDNPLLLIDGVPVFAADRLLATDPQKIKKIDVVSHKYIFGPSVTDGIVSFKSYDGDMAGYELDPNAVAVQYAGLQQHREFYAPVYDGISKGQPTIPDFREELLWAPEIGTGKSGKRTIPVFTSDLTGKFVAVVQGISKDGLAGYSTFTFSVAR